MITKKITPADAADWQLKELYQTAFPVEEQIPWNDLMRLVDEMHLDFTAYYEKTELREHSQACLDPAVSHRESTEGQGERFIGFTIVYPRPVFNWFWYFAVRPELRGMGKGQEILTALVEKYKGQSCVLDMESPRQVCENMELRKRRHDFYLRNGFRDTNVYRYFDDIEMTIMMMGEGTFTIQNWDEIVSELRQFWTWD